MAKVRRDSTSLPRSRSTAALGTVLTASGMSSADMALATSATSSGEACTTATSSSASTACSRNAEGRRDEAVPRGRRAALGADEARTPARGAETARAGEAPSIEAIVSVDAPGRDDD